MNLETQISQLRAQLAIKQGDPPPPPVGTEIVEAVPFDFSSGTMVLSAFPMGAYVSRAVVVILSAFDLGAAIEFGSTANPQAVVRQTDVTPSVPDQYDSSELVFSASADVLQLRVVGATVGSGVLFYRLLLP